MLQRMSEVANVVQLRNEALEKPMTVADHRSFKGLGAPSVGVGFKPEHFEAIVDTRPGLGFFEVHAENSMGEEGNGVTGEGRDWCFHVDRCMGRHKIKRLRRL